MNRRELQKRIQLHLGKLGPPECPICEANDWVVVVPVASMPLSDDLGSTTNEEFFPTVPVFCRRCRYVMHFAMAPFEQDAGNE